MARFSFTMMAKFLSQLHQIRSLTTVGASPEKEDFKCEILKLKVYNVEEEVPGWLYREQVEISDL